MKRVDRFRETAHEDDALAKEWANADFDKMCKETIAKKEMVNHPSHYNNGDMECIDAMVGAYGKDEVAIFSKISAFKYLWRLGHKDEEAQEIGKIKWYLDKYLELKENVQP